jgi:predicted ATP-grasp superfamily ATP-dependent carboligase
MALADNNNRAPGGLAGLPALVLGTGITALGTLRALAAAGIPAAAADRRSATLRWSRAARRRLAVPPPRAGEALDDWLANGPLEGAVLVPCSDSWARATAALPPGLAARFAASVPPPAALDALVDKARFAATLRRLDVPRPGTWLVPEPGALDAVPAAVFVSAFLKPVDSQAFFARYGVKGFWVRSLDEARRRFADIAAAGLGAILQEYVPGGADRHYFLDGFVDRNGEVRALFVRRRLRMHPADFGNSSLMVSIPADQAEPAATAIRRLLSGLRYRGPFSAEFKHDPRDGEFRLLEVNARMWWYVEFASRCGVNIPAMAWRDALGLPVPAVTNYAAGRTCMYPYYDWHASRPVRAATPGGTVRWLAAALRADQPVFRWSDPLPALAETAAILGSRLRRPHPRGEGP